MVTGVNQAVSANFDVVSAVNQMVSGNLDVVTLCHCSITLFIRKIPDNFSKIPLFIV